MRLYVAEESPEEWVLRSIDSVCTRVTSGGTPSRRVPEYFGGDISWVKTKELNDGWISKTEETITTAGVDNSSAKLLPTNTVLMAMYGATVGQLGLLSRPMTCNQAACALIVDDQQADYRYVFYQLLNARHQIADLANGAAQQNLNAGTIKALELPFPSLSEQHRIAATLSAMDEKIESNQQMIRLTLDFLDALSSRVGSELPVATLGSLVRVGRETLNPGDLGSRTVAHFSLPSFDEGARPELVPASMIMSNKLVVKQPTILVSRLNPRFNRTWWVEPDHDVPSLASTEFSLLTADSEESLAAVWLAVRDEFFRSEIARRVTGTSGSHQRVRPDDMLSIEVPDVSGLPEGVKMQTLSSLKLVEQLRDETASLERLRDTILPELLSGRIRVPQLEKAEL